MTEKDTTILKQYTNPLSRSIQEQYAISPDHYRGDIKLGLRNNDGTGVLVGVSKVGSVQGYLMQDGQRVPAPGKLYYRGIELTDIVEAHRRAGTFGFEEVAYLLLMWQVRMIAQVQDVQRVFDYIFHRILKSSEFAGCYQFDGLFLRRRNYGQNEV